MKRLWFAIAIATASACMHPVMRTTGSGLSVYAPGVTGAAPIRMVDPDAAAVDLYFARSDGRKVQDLPYAHYEVRAIFTEAVVRSSALLADFHAGVKARANSLTGYSLNVPAPGSPAGAGVPRLRYAQHSVDDDPYFPNLADGTKMLDPVADPGVYFLGQGLLKTAQANGFPPVVADVFGSDVSSLPVGSVNDVQSLKLGASAAEAKFNTVFEDVTYTDPLGTHPIAPVVQDRPLTDNTALTNTRYYKWRIPYAATALHLGSSLPLGRLILDIRLIDSGGYTVSAVGGAGGIVASGASARLLQAGANPLTVVMNRDAQGLVSLVVVELGPAVIAPLVPPAPGPLVGDFLATFPAGMGPHDLALDTSGAVWVANRSAGTVLQLSSSGVPLQVQPGFVEPTDAAIDPYGDIWVTDAGAGTVTRLSPSLLLRDVVAVGSAPEALAIDSSGDVWVANSGDSTVTKIANNGEVLGTFAVGTSPKGIAIDPAGLVRVTGEFSDDVTVLAPSGAVLTTYSAASGPIGLAIDLLGRTWVALSGSGAVGVFDGGGAPLASYLVGSGPRNVTSDAAVDAWTSVEGDDKIDIRAWDGTALAGPGTAPGPRGLVVDDFRGTAWVAEYGGGAGTTVRKLATGPLLSDGSTLAGSGLAGFADGFGGTAKFSSPEGLAMDAAGITYVADTANHRIRKITPIGSVSTLAGSGTPGWTDGPGFQARFQEPAGIAIDPAGNLYVADRLTQTVRKVSPAGVASTLAGNGLAGFANGAGSMSKFTGPTGIAVDPTGIVYVSEPTMHRIRKILPNGLTSAFAGTGFAGFQDHATGGYALFSSPRGLATDRFGTLYVADSANHRIRKITPSGAVSTLAGSATPGYVNGPVATARFDTPVALCFDASDNLYVLDQGNKRIRRISPAGIVSTVAWDGTAGFADGHPLLMKFSGSLGIAMNPAGVLTVADTANHRIRKLAPPGPPAPYGVVAEPTVTTLAGNGIPASVDGFGPGASFFTPFGIALDSLGRVLVGQIGDSRLRRVDPFGTVATLAGFPGPGFADGPLPFAMFDLIGYPVADPLDNAYVSDLDNHAVRYVDLGIGFVMTVAGTGVAGYANGPLGIGKLHRPLGLARSVTGDIYIADSLNHRIRRLDAFGFLSTVAGTGIPGGTDGPPGIGRLNNPHGLAIDLAGDLYVADSAGHRIRKVSPVGVITTIAGTGVPGYVDGPGLIAQFDSPGGVAVDAAGNVLVADMGNHRVRKIAPSGLVTTYAGSGPIGGAGAFADGGAFSARFETPVGVAVDGAGIVYVGDRGNNRIRKIMP